MSRGQGRTGTFAPAVMRDERDVQHKAADHGLHSRLEARAVSASGDCAGDGDVGEGGQVGERAAGAAEMENDVSERGACSV